MQAARFMAPRGHEICRYLLLNFGPSIFQNIFPRYFPILGSRVFHGIGKRFKSSILFQDFLDFITESEIFRDISVVISRYRYRKFRVLDLEENRL